MRRIFTATLTTVLCAAGALAPGVLAGKPALQITDVTGYSDAAAGGGCGFHVTVTYSGKAPRGATIIGSFTTENNGGAILGPEPLGGSPFTTATTTVDPGLLVFAGNISFAVEVQDKKGKTLADSATPDFTLDPSTFVDGCPVAGQVVGSP